MSALEEYRAEQERLRLSIAQPSLALADAAIAELEAKNMDLCEREILLRAIIEAQKAEVEEAWACVEGYRQTAEEANAEVARLTWMLDACIADNIIEYQEIRDAAKRDLARRYEEREG